MPRLLNNLILSPSISRNLHVTKINKTYVIKFKDSLQYKMSVNSLSIYNKLIE